MSEERLGQSEDFNGRGDPGGVLWQKVGITVEKKIYLFIPGGTPVEIAAQMLNEFMGVQKENGQEES